jgi:hypothetical protein
VPSWLDHLLRKWWFFPSWIRPYWHPRTRWVFWGKTLSLVLMCSDGSMMKVLLLLMLNLLAQCLN